MSEPTVSRSEIRRAMGRYLREEFFRRYGTGSVALSGGSQTDLLYSSDLTQGDDFWAGYWVYTATGDTAGGGSPADEERLVMSFLAGTDALQLERPLTAAPTSDQEIELWSLATPTEVHEAVNDVLRDAWKFFPNTIEDETTIIEEDKLIYDLSGLSIQPAAVQRVEFEQTLNGQTGFLTSQSTSTLTDSNSDFSSDGLDVDTDWLVSLYNGPGSGWFSTLASADSDGIITPDTMPTVDPTTESEYRIWDPTDQEATWQKMTGIKFSPPQDPDNMYLTANHPGSYGLRIRLTYSGQGQELSADSEETPIPKRYIVYKALSQIYDTLVGDSRLDRQTYAGLAEYYDQLARQYVSDHKRTRPAQTLWTEEEMSNLPVSLPQHGDPLGWG